MTDSSAPRPRYAGLDGLRAIAVVVVLAYHLFPGLGVRSGLVGVDVFFVVSGFLITSLLLRESRLPVRHRLLDFWRRRARRLLPALFLMLGVSATTAWVIGGDVLVGIGRQLLGAATFGYNWLALADGSDYFAAAEPELFRNVWSLAVEEQFYLLWPPLLLLVVAGIRRRWVRVVGALAAAGGSAWWMSVLAGDALATRAYFGTDSHAFGLLLGIALAFAVQHIPSSAYRLSRSAQLGVFGLGMLGIGLIVYAATTNAAALPGTLLLASAGSLLAVFAGILPGSWFGRAIDVAPLRWIGDRSYGIYLWHWPLLVLVSAASGVVVGSNVAVPVWAGSVTLVLTLLIATASYRYVETPVRRKGFRRAWRGVRMRRVRVVGAIAVGTAALGGTTAAVASAPEMTTSEMVIRAGAAAKPTPVPTTPATPAALAGEDVTAVGDSVMLASAPALYERMPGIAVDAEVSRSLWAGGDIIDSLESSGQLREHVVVALGTNGPVDQGMLKQIARTVGRDRDLVLVNAYAPREWIPGVNRDLAAFANARTGVVVADWSGAIAPHLDLLAGDQIHPGSAGGEIFAEVVEKGIRDAEAERHARPKALGWEPYAE
ncbi:acyltransferase family protein [Microbacterium esteraromaticum]|uniref:acyltransferase family protein n=1 Tax=Microbacterium esteraromaticum TaxID=57043 RepID=UPI0019565B48|nr:acyltransferase family protein [Microbacterium esteraromaticum]MBM7466684.1 peptidoglycan/LPS O-acetylase OafA/YrhL [Microbacterium esteraromaticum]